MPLGLKPARNDRFLLKRAATRCPPDDPFRLMVWTFEQLKDRATGASALTPKEREVARHIVNGHTSKETGQAMGI